MKKDYETIEAKLDGISWQLRQIAIQFERFNDILEDEKRPPKIEPKRELKSDSRLREFLEKLGKE